MTIEEVHALFPLTQPAEVDESRYAAVAMAFRTAAVAIVQNTPVVAFQERSLGKLQHAFTEAIYGLRQDVCQTNEG